MTQRNRDDAASARAVADKKATRNVTSHIELLRVELMMCRPAADDASTDGRIGLEERPLAPVINEVVYTTQMKAYIREE